MTPRLSVRAATFAGLLLLFLPTSESMLGGVQSVPGSPCIARLDSSQFSNLVPSHDAWETLWTRAAEARTDPIAASRLADDLSVSEESVGVLAAYGVIATSRMAAIRTVGPSGAGGSVSTPHAVSEAILEARDDLIRALPEAEFARVRSWVDGHLRSRPYTFVPLGRLVPSAAAGIRCHISVTGREHPELIPEPFIWEAYFHVLSSVARVYVAGGAEYKPENISVLQKHDLPISRADIQIVLEIALATNARVEERRSLAGLGDNTARRLAIAQIVLDGRSQLIRRLSKMSWLAVRRHANDGRAATIFDFPTF